MTTKTKRAVERVCQRFAIVVQASIVLCTIALEGCSHWSAASDEASSQVELPLIAVVDGVTYRLRHAVFDISGGATLTLNSEDDLDARVLIADLRPGTYMISLREGWALERATTAGWLALEATLVSPNPTTVDILPGVVARVVYRFETDGTIVTTGGGNLEIGFQVELDAGAPSGANCAAIQADLAYRGTVANVGNPAEQTTVTLTLAEAEGATFAGTASIAAFPANICGLEVSVPMRNEGFSLQRMLSDTRASGSFRLSVSGQSATVAVELGTISAGRACVSARVSIDPDLALCGTNVYEGTLCADGVECAGAVDGGPGARPCPGWLAVCATAGCDGTPGTPSHNQAGSNFERQHMSGDWSDTHFHGARLDSTSWDPGADLSNSNFHGADLGHADLSGVDLFGACLHGADLSNADLRDADLRCVCAHGADFRGANTEGVNWQGAVLHGAKL